MIQFEATRRGALRAERTEVAPRTEAAPKTERAGWPLARATLLTLSGFLIAIVGNRVIPQFDEGLSWDVYQLGPLAVDRNGFYRLVLAALMLIYLLAAARAVFEPARRARYENQAKFRFALGLALLAYDIAGTKLRVTPQPFFPGPAQILETFLIDGPLLLQNLGYSL